MLSAFVFALFSHHDNHCSPYDLLRLTLQRQDYHEIHLCRKISIKVFIRCSTNIRMRHAVDKSRFCFRGLELYKNAEYQAYQRELRQIAIQAVVVEANDQQLRGVTEPDRLRSVLEPASIKAARISLDQAFTDAMFAGTGAISSDVDSSSPLRQPQRMLSPKTQKQRLPPRGYDLRPRLFVHVPQSQAQTLFANRLSL